MQRWRCHKIVEAAKIRGIHTLSADEGGGSLLLFEGAEPEALVGSEWRLKHSPAVGGYFVRYDDGYTSWSPAEAFEAGYTRLPEESPA